MGKLAMQRQIGKFGVGLLVLLGVAGLVPTVHARSISCQPISKAQVSALFDHWNKALLTKRTETVVAAYAPDATLLPTVQTGPLVGPEEIGKYFSYFLKQSPQATIETRIIHTGCNLAFDVGLYAFMVDGDQPGSRKQVKARYTFIYAPVHGKWLIVHHHSSAVPAQ